VIAFLVVGVSLKLLSCARKADSKVNVSDIPSILRYPKINFVSRGGVVTSDETEMSSYSLGTFDPSGRVIDWYKKSFSNWSSLPAIEEERGTRLRFTDPDENQGIDVTIGHGGRKLMTSIAITIFDFYAQRRRAGNVEILAETTLMRQEHRAWRLLPKMRHGKWGYADSTGRFLVASLFEEASPKFVDGLARVRIAGDTGYVDTAGAIHLAYLFYPRAILTGHDELGENLSNGRSASVFTFETGDSAEQVVRSFRTALSHWKLLSVSRDASFGQTSTDLLTGKETRTWGLDHATVLDYIAPGTDRHVKLAVARSGTKTAFLTVVQGEKVDTR
jgi:hypothetical protein